MGLVSCILFAGSTVIPVMGIADLNITDLLMNMLQFRHDLIVTHGTELCVFFCCRITGGVGHGIFLLAAAGAGIEVVLSIGRELIAVLMLRLPRVLTAVAGGVAGIVKHMLFGFCRLTDGAGALVVGATGCLY